MRTDTVFQWFNSLGGSYLSSTAQFHLTLTDVNDNPPRLVKEYTGLFFCYPPKAPGSLIFEATDDDELTFRGRHFTFSLGSESLQKDWEVSKINGELSKEHWEKHWWAMKWVFNLPWCVCSTQHRAFFPAPERKFMLWKLAQASSPEGWKPPGLGKDRLLTLSVPFGVNEQLDSSWCTWIVFQSEQHCKTTSGSWETDFVMIF